jgi:hypothetical protein
MKRKNIFIYLYFCGARAKNSQQRKICTVLEEFVGVARSKFSNRWVSDFDDN